MTFRIERTTKAGTDLLHIWLAIAQDDPAAADKHLRRLEQAISELGDFPRMGPARDDISPGIRTILRAPYLIFYSVDDAECTARVVRIVDARRDLRVLFQD